MKRTTICLHTILMTLTIVISSCSLSFDNKKHKALSDGDKFSGIEVFNDIKLYYTPGDSLAWSIKAAPKLKSKLNMFVLNNKLYVNADGLKGDDNIEVWIMAPEINSFCTWNDGEIVVTDSLTLSDLSVTAYNSSKIIFDEYVRGDYVTITGYNDSQIYLSGCFNKVDKNLNNDSELGGNIECKE